jgi:paraquat-inducible protein A
MPSVIVCPACDLAHRRPPVSLRVRTQCTRCRATLQRPQDATIDTAIAIAITSLVLLFIGNAYPLVSMHVNGVSRETTLIGAAQGLYAQGDVTLAALVFLTTVIAPTLQIVTLLYVLIPLRSHRRARGQSVVFRVLTRVRPWSFMEVFMLGSLVALVRLANFAQVVPGVALWACALLMLSLSAMTSITSPEQFWRWVEKSRR